MPLSGGVEITRRCNLRCVHCYLGAERLPTPGVAELDTSTWLDLIDAIVAAGCINLVFTGGEPLLRPDFAAIYTRAQRSGLRVTLFTNATLVNESVVSLLREVPPVMVEVSIYGATERTYERMTGVSGSFGKALAGIERLALAGAPLTLKTVLTTINLGEFEEMERLAADHGARWRFDPAISPRLDGDRSPLAYRVSPADAASKEIPNLERASLWREYYESGAALPESQHLYSCGAGVTNFHIDPRGTLLPCLMSKRPAVVLPGRDFGEAWREIVDGISRMRVGAAYRCNACDKRNICSLCPPFHELECGPGDEPSAYLCQLGDKRRERIYSLSHGN